jgi:hypothetical protein
MSSETTFRFRQFSDSQALKNLKSLLLKEGDRKESLVISCAATDESRSDRRETSTRRIVETGDHCPGCRVAQDVFASYSLARFSLRPQLPKIGAQNS